MDREFDVAGPSAREFRDAVEVVVMRAEHGDRRIVSWTDFASDLLDAHICGFSPGDWQAAEGLATALYGSDWPPEWKRDSEDAAHIIVDPLVWPTSGSRDTAEDAEPGSPS